MSPKKRVYVISPRRGRIANDLSAVSLKKRAKGTMSLRPGTIPAILKRKFIREEDLFSAPGKPVKGKIVSWRFTAEKRIPGESDKMRAIGRVLHIKGNTATVLVTHEGQVGRGSKLVERKMVEVPLDKMHAISVEIRREDLVRPVKVSEKSKVIDVKKDLQIVRAKPKAGSLVLCETTHKSLLGHDVTDYSLGMVVSIEKGMAKVRVTHLPMKGNAMGRADREIFYGIPVGDLKMVKFKAQAR